MSDSATNTAVVDARDRVREMLDRLPKNCTIEDIQYQLYVTEIVDKRLQDLEAGAPVVSQEEAERRIAKWLK